MISDQKSISVAVSLSSTLEKEALIQSKIAILPSETLKKPLVIVHVYRVIVAAHLNVLTGVEKGRHIPPADVYNMFPSPAAS